MQPSPLTVSISWEHHEENGEILQTCHYPELSSHICALPNPPAGSKSTNGLQRTFFPTLCKLSSQEPFWTLTCQRKFSFLGHEFSELVEGFIHDNMQGCCLEGSHDLVIPKAGLKMEAQNGLQNHSNSSTKLKIGTYNTLYCIFGQSKCGLRWKAVRV